MRFTKLIIVCNFLIVASLLTSCGGGGGGGSTSTGTGPPET